MKVFTQTIYPKGSTKPLGNYNFVPSGRIFTHLGIEAAPYSEFQINGNKVLVGETGILEYENVRITTVFYLGCERWSFEEDDYIEIDKKGLTENLIIMGTLEPDIIT